MSEIYAAGLDVGSTTAKMILIDGKGKVAWKSYERHGAEIVPVISNFITKAESELGAFRMRLKVTGSAGMGISERLSLPFIQEVVATAELVAGRYPEVGTLIDVGGEDSKVIFLEDGRQTDIRMNGNCSGGTGSYIDQMATLLDIDIEEMDRRSLRHEEIHPIASRCGVFAKTDVQNLISRGVSHADIAASIFHAVAVQSINSLARGRKILPKIMFCGGPLTFIEGLRRMFIKCIGCDESDIVDCDLSLHLPAWGSAVSAMGEGLELTSTELLGMLQSLQGSADINSNRLEPLFDDQAEYTEWLRTRKITVVESIAPDELADEELFLGIDAGSTTTKLVVIDSAGRIAFRFYQNNKGDPLDAVATGMEQFRELLKRHECDARIVQSAVTGYGEDLVRTAYGIDHGLVETVAHYRAARHCDPKVSFILDIGGQDMKAIFVRNGAISGIEINEACSSGCGTFIEGFAESLGYTPAEFGAKACSSTAPFNLGVRCTIFMNSKVKQALRENVEICDLAAGLSYSVIKNSLYKVLKLRDTSKLGDNIVVQGGTFLSDSVYRALEKETGRTVARTNIPELMGAYGCALFALESYNDLGEATDFIGLDAEAPGKSARRSRLHCSGCPNNCVVTRLTFPGGRHFYIGNRCERVFSNSGDTSDRGSNTLTYKNKLLFERPSLPRERAGLTVGIPRILGMYEQYPFWHALFTGCGISVVLSKESDHELHMRGMGSILSDNICFPAKLAHGHIADLVDRGVNRIFYPLAVYERQEFADAAESYNCPIVSSYAEVLRSTMDVYCSQNIPFDSPVVGYHDIGLLRKACRRYFKSLGIGRMVFNKAFKAAIRAQEEFRENLQEKGREILERAESEGRKVLLLAGHPYHADPLIEQNTSQIVCDLGVDVINVEAVQGYPTEGLSDLCVRPQWGYPNRILSAARWFARQDDPNLLFVMLTSFGCGPDAVIIDEVKDILQARGKMLCLIKLDEISSPGSIKLRIRSLIESEQHRELSKAALAKPLKKTPPFTEEDRDRVILVPYFFEIFTPLCESLLKFTNYRLEFLPPPDRQAVEYGLRYTNNDVCYPAIIIVGGMIKALKSGRYDPEKTAVIMSQTGGWCRDTNYVSLIRRALVGAGFEGVPVIAASMAGKVVNQQPGFNLDVKRMAIPALAAVLYLDAVSSMYYSTLVREKSRGESDRLKDYYLDAARPFLERLDVKGVFSTLEAAVRDFNSVDCCQGEFPLIGVVGEIYLKYNTFSNMNIVDWMISQGVEVTKPPLLNFAMQFVVNVSMQQKDNLARHRIKTLLTRMLETIVNPYIARAARIMKGFRFNRDESNIRIKARNASSIISLANRFGEGWLIPAELTEFWSQGVRNVVSVQPFGCIANHIVSKGVEHTIRKRFPGLNMLFLDFDADSSEANVLNRLHFMIKNAKESLAAAAC